MALVVKEVVRVGLVQKVTKFISPPNPSSPSACLWKSDSFSKAKRDLLMARMREFRTSFFSTTQFVSPVAGAELHTSPACHMAAETSTDDSTVTSAGTSKSEVDSSLLDRDYGQEQSDHHQVAEDSHEHYVNTKDEGEAESLESTGFDISKVSKPSGDE